MRRFITMAALVVAAFSVMVATATAAAPTGNKAFCFDGTTDSINYYTPGDYGGTCKVLSPNKFFLDTNDATGLYGDYAGLAIENTSLLVGQKVSSIGKLGFTYSGTPVGGGAPRISIAINEDGLGSGYDSFAFAQASTCNDGFGKVDVINDPTCAIEYYSGGPYANWAAFLAAFPDATVGYAYTFIVADAPGEWTIWNVQLGAKSRGGK